MTMGKTMHFKKDGVDYHDNTSLRLELPSSTLSHASTSNDLERKWRVMDSTMGAEDGYKLDLGIGHPMSSSNSMVVNSAAKESDGFPPDDLGLDINLKLGNEKYTSPRKLATALPGPKFDLELSLSTVPAESTVTSVSVGSINLQRNFEAGLSCSTVPVVDEESTTSRWKLGNSVALWHKPHRLQGNLVANWAPRNGDPVPIVSDFPSTMIDMSHNSTGTALGIGQLSQSNTVAKACQFNLRVYMEVPCSVSHMVVASDVLCQNALRVREAEQTIVFVMVEEKGASLNYVEKARKEALISARHMEEAKVHDGVAYGA